jgi:methionyl aminopeptidase
VSLDVSVYLDGYHGDNCRTVLVQKETPAEMVTIDTDDEDHIQRAKLIMEATEEALLEAISVCHAGVEISEIGRVTHEIAERYGFRPLKNICGHGVGRHLHMLPEVKVRLYRSLRHLHF